MDKIVIEILTHLLHVFALVTVFLEGRVSKYKPVNVVKKRIPKRIRTFRLLALQAGVSLIKYGVGHFGRSLIGDKSIQDACNQLDALTGDELGMAVAEARAAARSGMIYLVVSDTVD